MKLLDKLLTTISIIFILSIILVSFFPNNIEIRSEFYQIIFDGYLLIISFLLILIVLVIKGIIYLIKEEWTTGLILIFIPGIVLFFSGFFFTLFIGDFGNFKKDIIVYEQNRDKIVFQYFETGITGNSNLRILKIKDNLNSSLRKYEEIDLTKYDSIKFIDYSILKANCNTIPKKIEYNGIEYKLKFCE
jgi:hypothetical protein